MNLDLRQRTFGELLGLCFQLPLGHFAKLFVIVVVLGVPNLILQLALVTFMGAGDARDPEVAAGALGITFLILIVALIIGPLQQGASILAVSGSFTGKHLSVGDCLGESLRRLPSLLGFGLAFGLIVGLGLLLLLVPGFIFMTWFFVGGPAIMLEKLGFSDAMGRSRELSAGHRWSIFGFIFVTAILVGAINGALTRVVETVVPIPLVSVAVQYLVTSIVSMISVVAPVVYYFQLRVVKEAFDVDALSSLVDAIGERGTPDAPTS